MAVTTNYSWNLPTVGGNQDTWGDLLNANWTALDTLLGGGAAITGIDINSGSIDGTVIGGASAAAGSFTTLSASSGASVTGAVTITGNVSVTGTVDGRDVSADGAKLDGIESGATADQTAAEILALTKTVDGSGSGLDADLLDGQHGSYYYPASNPNGYTSNVGDITGVTAGGGISGGGTSGTVTISHADTSSQGSVNNSGNTVIQDITLDTYGHITSIGSTTIPSGIGVAQTWQDVSGSRANNTQYRNTTGKPIMVFVTGGAVSGTTNITAYAGTSSANLIIGRSDARYGTPSVSFIVPDQHYYKVSAGAGIYYWTELR